MTASDLLIFLREGRHIFSVCTECGSLGRLSDLQLSKKGKYRSDWLDLVEGTEERVRARMETLVERKSELEAIARERARSKILPKLLERAAPRFYKRRINPMDVRTLISPTQFVAFKGLSSPDGVREVTFLHVGPKTSTYADVARILATRAVGWNTITLDDNGAVSEAGSGSRQRRLDAFDTSAASPQPYPAP